MSLELLKQFKKLIKSSKNIIILTGAGISAESGIPVFRGGSGTLWRTHQPEKVATPQAFKSDPSLVWEFYHYRREVAFNAEPNNAHIAIMKYEKLCKTEGRNLTIITQNVDSLHHKAGSENIIELHGSLRKVRCTKCGFVEINTNQPLCEGLRGRGDPNLVDLPKIPVDLLPRCSKCKSLARPDITWFGESLDEMILKQALELVEGCDLCLVVGTSSVVYPAAMFAPMCVERNITVAEFNINNKPAQNDFKFYFPGPCGSTIPQALNI